MPAVVVEDSRRALGDLARHWRARYSPVLIAITGSNGKTTVKEMLAAILRSHAGEGAVLATAGNLNNDIGLPLTLLRLRHAHRWCAIELGMNHKGEIAYLAGITRPTVALVNNAQREHLEFMRSVEEVAAENASAYDALPADGVAVVNADDPQAALFRRVAGARRIVDFGLARCAFPAAKRTPRSPSRGSTTYATPSPPPLARKRPAFPPPPSAPVSPLFAPMPAACRSSAHRAAPR